MKAASSFTGEITAYLIVLTLLVSEIDDSVGIISDLFLAGSIAFPNCLAEQYSKLLSTFKQIELLFHNLSAFAPHYSGEIHL